MKEQGTRIFISYAHEDESLRKELDKHLSQMKRQKSINVWHDRDISAGTEWQSEISKHLDAASIILLLISPDFIASDYCYSAEMKQAMKKHLAQNACVIPVILRSVDWEGAPFSYLNMLPTGGVPIIDRQWHNRDEAWFNVVTGIHKVLKDISIPQINIQQGDFHSEIKELLFYIISTFITNMADQVPVWLKGCHFQPPITRYEIAFLRGGRRISEEICKFLKDQIQNEIDKWIKTTLEPFILSRLKTSLLEVPKSASSLTKGLEQKLTDEFSVNAQNFAMFLTWEFYRLLVPTEKFVLKYLIDNSFFGYIRGDNLEQNIINSIALDLAKSIRDHRSEFTEDFVGGANQLLSNLELSLYPFSFKKDI